jgi:hypothetical protein
VTHSENKRSGFYGKLAMVLVAVVLFGAVGYLYIKRVDREMKYNAFMDDAARKRDHRESELKEALADCNQTLPITIDARCNAGRVEVKFTHPGGDNNGWIWIMRDRKCE